MIDCIKMGVCASITFYDIGFYIMTVWLQIPESSQKLN